MSRPREIAHTLLGILFWALIGVMWLALIRRNGVSWGAALSSTEMIAAIALFASVVMVLWIRHNLRIYETKGPRKGRPTAQPRTDVDRLGRTLVWDDGHEASLRSSYVVVELVGDVKRYGPAGREV